MRKHMRKRGAVTTNGGCRGVRRSRHGRGRTSPRQGRRIAQRDVVVRRKEASPCSVIPAEGVTGAGILAALSAVQKERLIRQLTFEL